MFDTGLPSKMSLGSTRQQHGPEIFTPRPFPHSSRMRYSSAARPRSNNYGKPEFSFIIPFASHLLYNTMIGLRQGEHHVPFRNLSYWPRFRKRVPLNDWSPGSFGRLTH